MDGGVADRAVGGVRVETAVPVWSYTVAAETQVSRALMCQHVHVRRSVNFVARGAALDPRSTMFIKKRPTLICVTG